MFTNHLKMFLVAFVAFNFEKGLSLDLRGPGITRSQSSTSDPEYASKAVDRNISSSSNSAYNNLTVQTNPWWKVDLGAVYCLRKITLVNIIDSFVRLRSGVSIYKGRVEVYANGQWGTVCDDGWGLNDANVICRELGFGPALAANSQAHYGPGQGPIQLDDLRCTGQEGSIFDCPHNGVQQHNCGHWEDAGVECALPYGRVRLQDGESIYEGRVEVYANAQWGTVCDDGWGLNDANVICRELGFGPALSANSQAHYGPGQGPIQLDNLGCTGQESSIFDCPHNGVQQHNCGHREDAGVECALPVRLQDGESIYEGRVEVYANGQWGTVCDDGWDLNDANVICRELGFGPALSANSQAHYGPGQGPIQLDNLGCTGQESSIFDCPHNGVQQHNCRHSEDAGIECAMPNGGVQPIRLRDGGFIYEGRVEVYADGQWGTVCDDGWDLNEANVICRELGFGPALTADCCAHYGRGQGPIQLDDLRCSGQESSIFDCPHNGVQQHNCWHGEDAGVECSPLYGRVRLQDGESIYEGRVEVYANAQWGTVCDDGWGLNDANVICRELGFGPALSANSQAHYGPGQGPIQLDDLRCTGQEGSIFDCPHNGVQQHNCGHREDAGVECSLPVRLQDGESIYEGRVEVYANAQWGTVCDDGWDLNDANVICRELGFGPALSANSQAHYGPGQGPIQLDNLGCTGQESSIFDCPHNGVQQHNCGHREDAGVECSLPADRLYGAVVRAGLSPEHLQNPVVGQPVAYDDAINGAVLDFLPEPYVTARYVSVDIPRSGTVNGIDTVLNMAEVMIEELTMDMTKIDAPSSDKALTLTGLPSSQSSTLNSMVASRAVDGSLMYGYERGHISSTSYQQDPWWKIDLSSVHCVGTIAVRNADHFESFVRLHLQDAVVRAGLNDTHLDNPTCGSAVTLYQALLNDWLDFTCPPHTLARYVSIDIPRWTYLQLAEVMVWPCDLHLRATNLTDKPSGQSSTEGNSTAEKAHDGLPTEPYCSLTMPEMNPWWMVDLEASQCLGQIRVWSFAQGVSFQDAVVVRAGLSSNFTDNVVCGQQVQASSDFLEFTCNPPVLAQYVSIDISGMAQLGLCEVTVATCDFTEKVDSEDLTVVVNPSLLGATGDNDSVIAVYRGPEEITSNVSFGRQISTGGPSGLPSGSGEIVDSSLGCSVRLLRLPEQGGLDRTGVLYAETTRNGLTTRIQTVILPKVGAHIRPVTRTQTASIGDSVILEMLKVNPPNEAYRWRRDGGDVIEAWNGLLTVSVSDIAKEDEGVYTCFVLDQEDEQLHGIMRLVVRDCPSGHWDPPSCLKTCRRCYNGGVCDDQSGTCVCAPGFSGNSCQHVDSDAVFGKTAEQRCSNYTDPHNDACRGRLFCLPDPYGCSCAAGYMGLDCMQECDEGRFGADCKQTCHCAQGGTCSKDTGECSNDCEAPYFGSNCQCSTQNGVLGLEVTSGNPNQLFIAWQPDPCSSGYEVTRSDDCGDIVYQELIPETTYHFMTGLESTLHYRVSVRPLYSGINAKGPQATFLETSEPTEAPTEVSSTSVTSSSMSFSWSKPPCGSRGDVITGYTYILTEVGPDSRVINQSVTSEESVTIQGLSPLTEYSFQVAANTTAGAGPYSEAEVEKTLKVTKSSAVSSAVVGGSAAAAVILIVAGFIVIVVLFKRRRRRKNQRSGDTSIRLNSAFQADLTYLAPAPIAEPGITYMGLGDDVGTISSCQPTARKLMASHDSSDYKVTVASAKRNSYTDTNPDVIKKSSLPHTGKKPKLPPRMDAADDSTYEVVGSLSTQKKPILPPKTDAADDDSYEVMGSLSTQKKPILPPKPDATDDDSYEVVGSLSTQKKPILPPKPDATDDDTYEVMGSLSTQKKPILPPKPDATDDDTYEVVDPGMFAPMDEGAKKSLVLSDARRPAPKPAHKPTLKPKPHTVPSVSKTVADEDPQEQLIQKLLSQLSSVRVDKLAEYFCEKEQAGQGGFPADFKTLPDGQSRPATVAMKPQNAAKNRDADIIVYDHSRVVLEPLQSDPHSNYINACFVDGHLKKVNYIASQGPIESTVEDFWRMVWQTKVDKIVMLTNLVENGKGMCHQYWPDIGSTNYSDIAVSIVKEDVFPDSIVRMFQINKFSSPESNRLVTQFQFKTWTDMELPRNPTTFLNFMRTVNAERNEGRTIVHCSNGIGRTGTYIALDSMLDQMWQEGQVDVLGFLYRMRRNRKKMVQTPAQYRFIFEALLAAYKDDDMSYEFLRKNAEK